MSRQRSNRGTKIASNVLGHFWQPGEKYFPVKAALITSDAWRTLKPIQRNILLDWQLWFYKCSNSDTRNLRSTGFKYAWSLCRIDCAESTFTKARKAIEERGFFVAPPELQTMRGDDAKLYLPGDWANWRPPSEVRAKLRTRENGKKKRIRRHQQRKLDHVSKLEAVSEIQGCHPRNSGGSHTPENKGDLPPESPGDNLTQNDGSHPRNSGGSIDVSMSDQVSEQEPDPFQPASAVADPSEFDSAEIEFNDPLTFDLLIENRRAAHWTIAPADLTELFRTDLAGTGCNTKHG